MKRILLALTITVTGTVFGTNVTFEEGVVTVPAEGIDRAITLTGPWEVYPGRALSPEEVASLPSRTYHRVPPRYGRFYDEDGDRIVSGPITFRLVVKGVPAERDYAVALPPVFGDVTAWVNGTLLTGAGDAVTDAATAEGDAPTRHLRVGDRRVRSGTIIPIDSDSAGRVELVIITWTEFYPYSGLATAPPRIGPTTILNRDRSISLFLDGLCIGALLVLALSQIIIAFGTRRTVPVFTLALLIVTITVRYALAEGGFIAATVVGFSPTLYTRLQALGLYPFFAFSARYIRRMFPLDAHHRSFAWIERVSWAFFVVSWAVPIAWWMDLLYGAIPIFVVTGGLFLAVLARAVFLSGRSGAIPVAIGYVALVGAVAGDFVGLIRGTLYRASLVEVAIVVFAFLVSLALLRRIVTFRVSIARLREQAQHDGLTKLFNRRTLDDRLTDEWERHVRAVRPVAVVMSDIDHFKRYNDTLGHQAGDRVLKAVADIVIAHARRSGDLPARYGGEEFALLLPNTDSRGAYTIAESIRDAVHSMKIPHPQSETGFVTVSVGTAAYVPGETNVATATAETLIAAADTALYDAKATGRNAVRTASLEMGPPSHQNRDVQ